MAAAHDRRAPIRAVLRARICGLCLLTCLPGCAGAEDPLQRHVERELGFLGAGLDPLAEAEAIILSQLRAGLPLRVRVGDARRVLLYFASADGQRQSLRLVTRRGVALALEADAGDPLAPSHLRMVSEQVGAPGEFLYLAAAKGLPGEEACARVWVVEARGWVRELSVDLEALGEEACLSRLSIRGGKLGARLRWPRLIGDPEAYLELGLEARRRVPTDPMPVRLGLSRDPGRRSVALALASRRTAMRRASAGRSVAEAALARLSGRDSASQLSLLRRPVTRPGQEPEGLGAFRRYVSGGWSLEEPEAPVGAEVAPVQPGASD